MSNRTDRPVAPDSPAEQDTEVRFRTLFEQAPFSVQLVGPDGRTRRVNRAWEALWVPPGDADVLPLRAERIQPARGSAARGHRRRPPACGAHFAGESVEVPPVPFDPRCNGHAGPVRWVKAQLHPVRDDAGRVVEVMLIHQDVSEQVRTDQLRTESERRLRQLANTIPQMAWIADRDGQVLWFNDRWYAYTGAAARRDAWQRLACRP